MFGALVVRRRLVEWVVVMGLERDLRIHVWTFRIQVRVRVLGREIRGLGWGWETVVLQGGLRLLLKAR